MPAGSDRCPAANPRIHGNGTHFCILADLSGHLAPLPCSSFHRGTMDRRGVLPDMASARGLKPGFSSACLWPRRFRVARKSRWPKAAGPDGLRRKERYRKSLSRCSGSESSCDRALQAQVRRGGPALAWLGICAKGGLQRRTLKTTGWDVSRDMRRERFVLRKRNHYRGGVQSFSETFKAARRHSLETDDKPVTPCRLRLYEPFCSSLEGEKGLQEFGAVPAGNLKVECQTEPEGWVRGR